MDIPFIRFAFPLLILYLFWNTFIVHPWLDEPVTGLASNPSYVSPNAARELLEQSQELVLQSRYEAAMNPLLRLHQAYPEDHIYIQALAENYDRLSRYREAVEMWEQFLQFSPTPIEGCPQIGLDYQKLGKAQDALKAFERCWNIEPNAETIFFYAHALEMEGQAEKALKLYQEGLARAPNYPDLGVGLARVQSRLGQSAAARPRIDAVLQRFPENVDALVAAGLVYSELGDVRTALIHLRHAQRVSPQNKDVLQVLARVSRQGDSQ